MRSRRTVGGWEPRAGAVALAGLLVSCSSGGDPREAVPAGGRPVSERAARHVLDEAVAASLDGDLDRLCRRSASVLMCETTLHHLGEESVPATEPQVLATRAVEPIVAEDGGAMMGGRVVEVCGRDGRGRPYQGEIMVIDHGRAPAAMNPVYWAGIRYHEPGDVHVDGGGVFEATVEVPADAPGSPPAPGCPT